MNEDLVKRAINFFGIQPAHIHNVEKGYRNSSYHFTSVEGHDLNLIFYKNESGILDRIKRADQVSELAFSRGLSVRHLYDTRILTLKNNHKTIYARLYHYLPGQTIAWEMYSMKHIKLLGQAMSDLHSAIKDSRAQLPLASNELLDQHAYISEYFANPSIQKAVQTKLQLRINQSIFDQFKQTILIANELPSQPLHLDLVRGNILYSSHKLEACKNTADPIWQISDLTISGLIDFEKSARGHVIFDLARSYAFLLADCANKTPDKIYKYLIHSGYNKRGSSYADFDRHLFDGLVSYYLFYDFYKFLEHNPYEFLNQNHHYLRTRDILIDRKVLKSS